MKTAETQRKKELAIIHIGAAQLGLKTKTDDSAYRDMLKLVCNVESASELSSFGRNKLIKHMKKCGFKVRSNRKESSKVTDDREGLVFKITALWHLLAEAGVVTDKSEKSMTKWCSRITKKAALQWSSKPDLIKCVEGLKQWCNRTGVQYQEGKK